jgi:hypothetical protein
MQQEAEIRQAAGFFDADGEVEVLSMEPPLPLPDGATRPGGAA